MAFMHSNWRHWYFSNVKNTPFLHVKFYLQIYKEWVTNSTLLVVQAVAEMFWRWKLILPLGIWRHGRLMEESVSKVRFILELANPFIPVSKSIMLFLSKSMFLMISLSGLSFTSFQIFGATGPGSPKPVLWSGLRPTAVAVLQNAFLPRLITASPLDAQDWCLHNAFLCVLSEALLTYVGEDLLAFVVQVVRLVEWSFR